MLQDHGPQDRTGERVRRTRIGTMGWVTVLMLFVVLKFLPMQSGGRWRMRLELQVSAVNCSLQWR